MQYKMKDKIVTCTFPVFVVLATLVCTGLAEAAEKTGKYLEKTDDAADPHNFNTKTPLDKPKTDEVMSMPEGMMQAMDEFLASADLAHKMAHEGILPQEDIDAQYSMMAQLTEEILDYLYSADHVYGFLNAKALDTIIAPNMHIAFSPLRTPLLLILKALFEIAPTTTVTVIPNSILDRLVDIFERDDNLAIKTHVIELLSLWLPTNPHAQARVMKMKGLQPFYKQLTKLDAPVTRITLQLFNTILDEHIVVRNSKTQKKKADYMALQLYQQIGMIERLSTPMMCNGLVKIVKDIFSFEMSDKEVVPPVLKLLQTVKPYCRKVFLGRGEVADLIEQVLKYVQEPTKRQHLETLNVNVTGVIEDLSGFVEMVNQEPHSEL